MCLLRQGSTVLGAQSMALQSPRSLLVASPASRSMLSRGSVVPRFAKHSARAASAAFGKDGNKSLKEEKEEEFEDFDSPDDPSALSTQQVQTLLNMVCRETQIAEIELAIGGFSLKVRRKMSSSDYAATTFSANGAEAQPSAAIELPFQSTTSIDEAQVLPPSDGSVASVDEDDYKEENLLYLGAPKVGILRRGRYIKGKRVGKGPVADVGTSLKKGQPVAFIEQLGTFVPVEAPQAGEIVSFVADDGNAVEYKEVIVEIAPFFGGHIIGDKKYA